MPAPSPAVSTHLDGHVATILLQRPPHNFFEIEMLKGVADALEALDAQEQCRAVVLAAEGKSFCAGAELAEVPDIRTLYGHAMRMFRTHKPIVAAVQGAAIGGGLGLALVADFRITCESARFSANFNRLGVHPGFGSTFTLPRLVGPQVAARMFFTGERIDGSRAVQIGLADELVPESELLARAQAFAREIAASAPRAVQATRATMRLGFAEQVAAVNAHELQAQTVHFQSEDFREGYAAAKARRQPVFKGR